jgi:hypothetical protein
MTPLLILLQWEIFSIGTVRIRGKIRVRDRIRVSDRGKVRYLLVMV